MFFYKFLIVFKFDLTYSFNFYNFIFFRLDNFKSMWTPNFGISIFFNEMKINKNGGEAKFGERMMQSDEFVSWVALNGTQKIGQCNVVSLFFG